MLLRHQRVGRAAPARWLLCLAIGVSGCAFGNIDWPDRDAGADATSNDGRTSTDARTGTDVRGSDTNVATDVPQGRDANSGTDVLMARDVGSVPDLDPQLSLPDPAGRVCTNPGGFGGCPSGQVCRFYSSSEGRCETCTACGNLNAPCSASNECDILFMCFRGRCTNFCTLGTSECGPPDDCVNIGHATRGVCNPF